jgi:hypothetical protein
MPSLLSTLSVGFVQRLLFSNTALLPDNTSFYRTQFTRCLSEFKWRRQQIWFRERCVDFFNTSRWRKSRNRVILSVICHCRNGLELRNSLTCMELESSLPCPKQTALCNLLINVISLLVQGLVHENSNPINHSGNCVPHLVQYYENFNFLQCMCFILYNELGNVCVTWHCGAISYPFLQWKRNNTFCVCCWGTCHCQQCKNTECCTTMLLW